MNRRKLVQRIGCLILFFPWLIVMFSPCVIVALAIQREIKITWSDVPDDALHVWTISERNLRGVALQTPRRVNLADGNVCMVIDVRFLIWQGDAEAAGALPSHQCTCYTKRNNAWDVISAGPEACVQAGESPGQ